MSSAAVREAIYEAIAAIAASARIRNDKGFDANDVIFATRIAAFADPLTLSEQELGECFRILPKYRAQVRRLGLEFPPAPDVSLDVRHDARVEARDRYWQAKQRTREAANQPRLDLINGVFILTRAYPIVESVKALPYATRAFDSEAKVWRIFHANAVVRLINVHGGEIIVSRDVEEALDTGEAEQIVVEPRVMRALPDGERVEFKFPHDADLVDDIRTLPGRYYDRDRRRWTAELTLAAIRVARRWNFAIEPAELLSVAEEIEADSAAIQEELDARAERSRAIDTDVTVAIADNLFPFQRAGVAYALETKRTFIADEMGLGKTRQAISVAETASAYPMVVVCPSTLKKNWERECNLLIPNRTVEIVKGRTPHDLIADITIINYDILPSWVLGCVNCGDILKGDNGVWIHDEKKARGKRKPGEARCIDPEPVTVFRNIRMLVLDESHYAKNPKASRTAAAIALAEQVDDTGFVLNLTGTPLLNRPVELIAQLDIIGRLDEFGGETQFLRRYVDYQWNGNSFTPTGAKNVDELHNTLRSFCYVRRMKVDVLTELPAKMRAPQYITFADCEQEYAVQYREAYTSLIPYLSRTRGQSAAARAARAEAIVRINVLRTLAARAKVEAAVDWVNDFLKSGKSLVIFAVHKDIQERLIRDISRYCKDENYDEVSVVSILGGAKGKALEAAKQAFNNQEVITGPDGVGRKCKVIVCSLAAAREGHTLTRASDVLFVELGWTPGEHAQAEDRCHRVCMHGKQNDCPVCGFRDNVTAWYFLIEDSIDEDMNALIEEKRKVVDAVANGIESLDEETMMGALIERLRDREIGD